MWMPGKTREKFRSVSSCVFERVENLDGWNECAFDQGEKMVAA